VRATRATAVSPSMGHLDGRGLIVVEPKHGRRLSPQEARDLLRDEREHRPRLGRRRHRRRHRPERGLLVDEGPKLRLGLVAPRNVLDRHHLAPRRVAGARQRTGVDDHREPPPVAAAEGGAQPAARPGLDGREGRHEPSSVLRRPERKGRPRADQLGRGAPDHLAEAVVDLDEAPVRAHDDQPILQRARERGGVGRRAAGGCVLGRLAALPPRHHARPAPSSHRAGPRAPP
jgi:hypothetical protein